MSCAELRTALGAMVVGALPEGEAETVRTHLRTCPECRREEGELAALPPLLALIDADEAEHGPAHPTPAGAERLLAEAAARRAAHRRRRLVAGGVAAAVLVGVGTVGGLLLDREKQAALPPSVAVAGRAITDQDPRTGVAATVSMSRRAWGTAVHLELTGVPGGLRCRLVAVGPHGSREVAATWAVPVEGYTSTGTLVLDGSVGRAADELRRFEVVTNTGRTLLRIKT